MGHLRSPQAEADLDSIWYYIASRNPHSRSKIKQVDGLRFACQPGCTKCCRKRGFIYLSEDDLARAAQFVGMTASDFEAKYVIRYRHLLRLRKPRGGQCHFLEPDGCSIHPAKPTQCRLYPFWPELVENRKAWNAEKHECPGIGKGELVQIGTACETADEMKRAYPSLYA